MNQDECNLCVNGGDWEVKGATSVWAIRTEEMYVSMYGSPASKGGYSQLKHSKIIPVLNNTCFHLRRQS